MDNAILGKMQQEMGKMKMHFPFRIIFAILEESTYRVYAETTRHRLNKAVRNGEKVYVLPMD